MTTVDIGAVADELMAAYEGGTLVGGRWPELEESGAYAVLDELSRRRVALGWRRAGWKLGFTNRSLWPVFGVDRAFCAPLWHEALVRAENGAATFELGTFRQPRIEPEVVFKLKSTPPPTDDADEVLAHVEWMAAGFEIVQCPYDGWKFSSAECTAAFGLHGAMVLGDPVPPASPDTLVAFELVLARDGEEVDRGVGANALDSPALALAHLTQIAREPLQPGAIVTTGTLTNAWPIEPGQTWTSDYTRLGVSGLTLSLR
jgi:2-oxo-3-hexenedioate decarboxylase